MTVKRFVAPDMRRALDLVRSELGPDAIILSSQRTAQGVEIITSIEPQTQPRGVDERKSFSQQFDQDFDRPLASDQAWENREQIEQAAGQYPVTSGQRRGETLERELEAARIRMLASKKAAAQAAAAQSAQARAAQARDPRGAAGKSAAAPAGTGRKSGRGAVTNMKTDRQMKDLVEQVRDRQGVNGSQKNAGGNGDARLTQLQNDISDMRMLLEQQMWQLRDNDRASDRESYKAPVQSLSVETLEKRLARMGLPSHLVRRLASCATPGKSVSVAWRESLARLSRLIPVNNKDPIAAGGVFAFVGPTGVGKTTTIAKLASRYVLENGLGKVALITTDTYRVGAHDQLKALGRILSVPVRVVDQERSLAQTVASLRNFPLILIDTAGFRQGDPLRKEQDAALDACPGVQRILTLACNSQVQTLKASAHAYGSASLAGCVLTKIDETASLGEALGVMIERNLPVLYSTDGQGIPKDIAPASAATLVAKSVALLKALRSAEADLAISP